MKECDLIQQAIDNIIVEGSQAEEMAEEYIDKKISADKDSPMFASSKILRVFGAISRIRDPFRRTTEQLADQIRKGVGALEEREALALEIRTKISAVPHLAEAIIEEITSDIIRIGEGMNKQFFELDEKTQEDKILLWKMPISVLRRQLTFIDAWINADPDKWNSLYYRGIKLAWGITRKIRFTENSGAYNKVWKATQDFADRQAYMIDKFIKAEGGTKSKIVNMIRKGKIVPVKRKARTQGMDQILDSVEYLYDSIPNKIRTAWESTGFFARRSKQHGKEAVTELFTWMMHGRVEYIDAKKAKKMTKEKPGQPSRLIYEHGEGWYINEWWAPTSNSFDNGDVIFGWQNPVPLRFDSKIHEQEKTDKNGKVVLDRKGKPVMVPTATDHKGNTRYDTHDFIKNLPPLSDDQMSELAGLQGEARDIMDESFAFLTNQTEESFKNILLALKKNFPNKKLTEIKRAIVEGKFEDKNNNPIWTSEEKAKLLELEEQFTKYSLEAPFKPTMNIASYKAHYFPYVYMPEKFIFLIEDAILSMEASLEKVIAAKSAVTGSQLMELRSQQLALEQSIDRQREMKKALLGFEIDAHDDDKMLTRTKSKHYKHVSNAFDVLKSRTDRGVFKNYLQHTARQIARTNLTAELISAMAMTDHSAVKDAMTSLYKRTMAMEDARSLVLGFDISDENINPTALRAIKHFKRYLNLLLSGPQTAFKQSYGMIEKVIKGGFPKLIDSMTFRKQNLGKLQRLLSESGVTLFDEFFTNSIVKELETLEASRDDINLMLQAYGRFYIDRENGKSNKKAADDLKKRLEEIWKVVSPNLKWENILSKDELKQFNKKMAVEKWQRLTNNITAYAITNQRIFRDSYREHPSKFIRGIKNVEIFVRMVRDFAPRAGVMSEMEKYLRETSFIRGVMKAQSTGKISQGNMADFEPGSRDYQLAIKYGREATNIHFDFGMSRQAVGELYGSATGSLLGGFSVWKSQKFGSDTELFKNLIQAMEGRGGGTELLYPPFFYKAAREIFKSNKYLEQANPDALLLKRWLQTNFLIELVFQSLYVLPLLPAQMRSTFRLLGVRELGGAGSPLASLIVGPILILINAAIDNDDPWEDIETAERTIAYHIRNLPGFGVGMGFIYDLIVVLAASIEEEEELLTSKAKSMIGYVMPAFSAVRKAVVEAVEKIID